MTTVSPTSPAPAATLLGRIASALPRLRKDQVAYPLGYLASLDGCRGLMTLGVLLAHTRMALFSGAMIYMDIFFVMSGYLITSLLIADQSKHGMISLRKFYVRRLLRLYPALTVMLCCFLLVCWFFSKDFQARLTEAGVTFLYFLDYWQAFGFGGGVYMGHTWSLAVEEQFYLLWPLTFILLLRLFGLSRKTAATIFAMAAAFAVWRIHLTYTGANLSRLYNSFDTRADALLVGCGLAVVLKLVDLHDYPRLSRFLAGSLAPLACFEIAMGFTMDWTHHWYYYVSPLFGTIPGAIGIAALVQPSRTFMHRIYEHPVPVYCGRICYGLYIWHFPIFVWIAEMAPPHRRYILTFLVGWPLTFAVATASYFLIERRFMRSRPV
jgi:peptidoglycan/LPS O-acetylase OafA/YrhL